MTPRRRIAIRPHATVGKPRITLPDVKFMLHVNISHLRVGVVVPAANKCLHRSVYDDIVHAAKANTVDGIHEVKDSSFEVRVGFHSGQSVVVGDIKVNAGNHFKSLNMKRLRVVPHEKTSINDLRFSLGFHFITNLLHCMHGGSRT